MKSVIAKYPIKIGDYLVPKGSIGEIVEINDMKKYFPNITRNDKSNQIAVKFSLMEPCIIHRSQVIIQ